MTSRDKNKIGITGSIGSGKSTVCRIFEQLGLPVYYSDKRAKELIHVNKEIITLYKRLFGSDIYSSGQLDRQRVAGIIFSNPGCLKEVEQLVHPIVRMDFEKWMKKQDSGIVLNEAAVLFESGGYKFMDAVITVTAPEALRLERVKRRDGLSEDEIRARMELQWPDDKKCSLSQVVIVCDDVQMVIPQVLDIYKKLHY